MQYDVQIVSDGGVAYTEPFVPGQMLAIQFNVERSAAGTGTLTATPQHSGDGGRTWIDKTALTLTGSGAFAASGVTGIYGGDGGSVPHHGLMRLKLSTTVAAKVRVFVHARGRARPVMRLAYHGIVPISSLYSPPFALDPGTERAALHALVTPVGANTNPAITVQLEVTHDGNNWGSQTATPEINGTSVTVRQENSVSGWLDLRACRGPVGRLRLVSGSASGDNASHVRVYVTHWVKPPKLGLVDPAHRRSDDAGLEPAFHPLRSAEDWLRDYGPDGRADAPDARATDDGLVARDPVLATAPVTLPRHRARGATRGG